MFTLIVRFCGLGGFVVLEFGLLLCLWICCLGCCWGCLVGWLWVLAGGLFCLRCFSALVLVALCGVYSVCSGFDCGLRLLLDLCLLASSCLPCGFWFILTLWVFLLCLMLLCGLLWWVRLVVYVLFLLISFGTCDSGC